MPRLSSIAENAAPVSSDNIRSRNG
jgi:hypothetical protein